MCMEDTTLALFFCFVLFCFGCVLSGSKSVATTAVVVNVPVVLCTKVCPVDKSLTNNYIQTVFYFYNIL